MVSPQLTAKIIFEKSELWIFLALIVVYLYPIWSLEFFPVLDAMGHIYNADILWSLWFDENSIYKGIFSVNSNFSPNWISHPLLAILTRFFDPFTIEKIVLSMYIIGFSLAFRFMIFSLNIITKWMSLLAFVFLYGFTFIYGFLNYNFGLIFLFLSIGIFNHQFADLKKWRFVLLGITLVALYFSHLIATFFFFIYVGVFAMWHLFVYLRNRKLPDWFSGRNLIFFLLTFCFPVLMNLIYVIGDKESDVLYYWTAKDIWHNLYYQTGYFCFGDHEWLYTRWNRNVFLGGLLISILWYSFLRRKNRVPFRSVLHLDPMGGVIMLYALAIGICTFILPDASPGGGGLLTIRLIYLTTTFLIIALFLLFRLKWLVVIMLIIANVVSIDKMGHVYRTQKTRQVFCREVKEVSAHFHDGGVLLFFNYREGDFLNHYPKAIAIENHMITLDDLGAHKIFSPLQWSGDLRKNEDLMCWLGYQWNCNLNQIPRALDGQNIYILVHGSCEDHLYGSNRCGEWLDFFIDECELIYRGMDEVFLYKVKTSNAL